MFVNDFSETLVCEMRIQGRNTTIGLDKNSNSESEKRLR